ncbi:hypothetical protein [Tumebacillus permanentifrigoris]|uniref:Uncharacterized protein n=1 Tax=Tumebacillus permanentifrigoris TaxID=378543 RepID=A0A316DAY9_9BACL|nr:hypothetical protein [Tumebacillus permanentifrigoris]PWK14972.1 hypothetical protein C7459_104176 [Tumebacillus permanentifrigoris]
MKHAGRVIITAPSSRQSLFASESWQKVVDSAVANAQFQVEKDPSVRRLKEKLFAVKVGG